MRNLSLSHKLSQRLLITPKIKQALYILQLPYCSFETYLQKQIAENPLLQPLSKENLERGLKKLLISDSASYPKNQTYTNRENEETIQFSERASPQSQNLQQYVLQQIRTTFLNDDELLIAQEIVNCIDNNGYLRISLEQFAKEHNFSLDKVEPVLKNIQSLEPSGIGARDLRECLLIQLKNDEQEQSLAYKIIQSHLRELAKKSYQTIVRKLHANLEDVKIAVKKIKTLNPRPGTVITQEETHTTIIPDIFVNVSNNRIRLTLNNDNLPQLKINSYYKNLLQSPYASEETAQFVKERLKSALWLIEAIKQRQTNMVKVVNAIVEAQKQALQKDLSYLKPLRLKDIAHKTGLHLSTVARIVSYKYIATPQGTIRVKDLFSPKLSSNRGRYISRKNVLFKIQNIILNNKQERLSDQNITEILQRENIVISRRTVTKYRNLLKIPPLFLR